MKKEDIELPLDIQKDVVDIVDNYRLALNMATITTLKRNNYGIIIIIKSSTTDTNPSNTGKNEHRPPHAHLFDEDKNEIGRFLLSNETDEGLTSYTSSIPKSKDDIREIEGDSINGDYKKRVFKYMTEKEPKGRFATNWERTIDTWNEENELWEVELV